MSLPDTPAVPVDALSSSVRPPVVGVVGGGQLARMMQPAAVALGVELRLLSASDTDSAAQVIPLVMTGDEADLDTLRRFAQTCDVLTFDHEQVPTDHLRILAQEGVVVRPGPEALVHAQDKIVLRQRLDVLGVPQPAWEALETAHPLQQLETFGSRHGWPVILKTARGGYDGKGVWHLHSLAQASAALTEAAGQPLLVEQHIAFRREVAAQVARRPSGQMEVFPLVQTVQREGICGQVMAPAPDAAPEMVQAAAELATTLASQLGVCGMLAVELFDTGDSSRPLLVNELAMRPHNSGHWSIDGASISQFEQHLRAVLDWPLAPVHLLHPATVMVNLLGGTHTDLAAGAPAVWQREPSARIHLYGKVVQPGRKVGHVTFCGHDVQDLVSRSQEAAVQLTGQPSSGSSTTETALDESGPVDVHHPAEHTIDITGHALRVAPQ